MNAGNYTSGDEEVPLGVECALPRCAGTPLRDEASIPDGSLTASRIDTVAAHPRVLPESGLPSEG